MRARRRGLITALLAVAVDTGVLTAVTPNGPVAADAAAPGNLCRSRPVTIVGTSGPDRLRGTPGSDVIWTGAGNDTIRSLAGNDRICSGRGDDRVFGAAGRDRLQAGAGDDRFEGADHADNVRAGDGDDVLLMGGGHDVLGTFSELRRPREAGDDRVWGGMGRDFISPGRGADVVHGGRRADMIMDRMYGGSFGIRLSLPGPNTYYGGLGRDWLFGGRGPDQLSTGPGRDVLDGYQSDDVLRGGRGRDKAMGGRENRADRCVRPEIRRECELIGRHG